MTNPTKPVTGNEEVVALLPCPFCGGNDLVCHKDFSEDEPTRQYAFHMFCRDCHCHGRNLFRIGWAETERAAMEAWNTRATSPPEQLSERLGMREALREQYARIIRDHTCAGYADDKVLGIYQAVDAILALSIETAAMEGRVHLATEQSSTPIGHPSEE